MVNCFIAQPTNQYININIVMQANFDTWLAKQDKTVTTWIKNNNFTGDVNTHLVVPDTNMNLQSVIVVIASLTDLSYFGALARSLPDGEYFIEQIADDTYKQAALYWAMGAYQFTKYKQTEVFLAKLALPEGFVYAQEVANLTAGIYLTRDLVNTPCEDMSPEDLSASAKALANEFDARFKEIVGDKLLKDNFPAIHAVGRASVNAPRLIELTWGESQNPSIILVGKGVCFDTGGYDIKSASGMRLMKKDMGGAAHVLGLARVIMAEKLPIHLTVLIPAVENAIEDLTHVMGDLEGSSF